MRTSRSSFAAHFCTELLFKIGNHFLYGDLLHLMAPLATGQGAALFKINVCTELQIKRGHKVFLAALFNTIFGLDSQSKEAIWSPLEICYLSWLY